MLMGPKILLWPVYCQCLMLHLSHNLLSRAADQPLGYAQTMKSVSKVQRPLIEHYRRWAYRECLQWYFSLVPEKSTSHSRY